MTDFTFPNVNAIFLSKAIKNYQPAKNIITCVSNILSDSIGILIVLLIFFLAAGNVKMLVNDNCCCGFTHDCINSQSCYLFAPRDTLCIVK